MVDYMEETVFVFFLWAYLCVHLYAIFFLDFLYPIGYNSDVEKEGKMEKYSRERKDWTTSVIMGNIYVYKTDKRVC